MAAFKSPEKNVPGKICIYVALRSWPPKPSTHAVCLYYLPCFMLEVAELKVKALWAFGGHRWLVTHIADISNKGPDKVKLAESPLPAPSARNASFPLESA